jgi:hypothetical protein
MRRFTAGRSPYLRLTYESFVAAPGAALQRLSVFADDALGPSGSELTGTEVKLGGHRWIPLRLDNEWQTRLSTAQFAKVTAITWPLLRLYGYPTVPAARKRGVVGAHQPE